MFYEIFLNPKIELKVSVLNIVDGIFYVSINLYINLVHLDFLCGIHILFTYMHRSQLFASYGLITLI